VTVLLGLQGFLARAKGIPALELYRLAQKKNRRLVLCGHSLGGAVRTNNLLRPSHVLEISSWV
jgi:alpha-beta hydrolase superfamily lysophospholipase